MLERGEIPDDQFTMRRVQHPCRTPACLCGWANHVSGGRAFPLEAKPGLTLFSSTTYGPRWREMSRRLHNLFAYGGRPIDPVYLASPSQAAIALRNFLTRRRAALGRSARGIGGACPAPHGDQRPRGPSVRIRPDCDGGHSRRALAALLTCITMQMQL